MVQPLASLARLRPPRLWPDARRVGAAQRELLDGDDARLELLAEHVFRQPHAAIVALARELATDLDPYMLADSVIGLVLFSFQTAPLRRHLAERGGRPERPEDIARHGHIATAYAYPVKVEGRYVMDPSPIPRFDNPKLSDCPAIQLFGAGREQRIYALPPYTRVVSLDFDDHPFQASKAPHDCDLCGSPDSYLDEVITDDAGGRMFVCSDTDFCAGRREQGKKGRLWAPEPEAAE